MSESQKESVKDSGASLGAVTDGKDAEKDHRGVPKKNVDSEWKRKYEELASETEQIRARMSQIEDQGKKAANPEDDTEARRKKIEDFVSDPDAYIEKRVRDREFARELPNAVEWLKSQKDYSHKDEAEIARIIRENGLNHTPSPMARAKSAWKILQAERLSSEFESRKMDMEREEVLKKNGPDGSKRSANVNTSPKRDELIKKLAEAEKKGDMMASARLLDKLEDTRE